MWQAVAKNAKSSEESYIFVCRSGTPFGAKNKVNTSIRHFGCPATMAGHECQPGDPILVLFVWKDTCMTPSESGNSHGAPTFLCGNADSTWGNSTRDVMRSPRRQNHSRNPIFSLQECRKHINKWTSHPVKCKITNGIRHVCRAMERNVWNCKVVVTSWCEKRKIL